MNKFVKIAIALVICLTVGYSASLVTRPSIETWYVTLEKPVFNPPNWIFAPVWTVLYIMMGVAGGMIWNRIETDEPDVKNAFQFFIICSSPPDDSGRLGTA